MNSFTTQAVRQNGEEEGVECTKRHMQQQKNSIYIYKNTYSRFTKGELVNEESKRELIFVNLVSFFVSKYPIGFTYHPYLSEIYFYANDKCMFP